MRKIVIYTLNQLVKQCENQSEYLINRINSGGLTDEQLKLCEHDLFESDEHIETFKTLIEKWSH